MFNLHNQKFVIIGGSSGIGLATAILAASYGAKIAIAGRSMERLNAAKERIQGEVDIFSLDISNENALKEFFNKLGPFDHLITPGSYVHPGSFQDFDLARKSFDSKFWGQYLSAKYAQPHLKNGGSVVFVSGVVSQRPFLNSVIMASINSAIEGLARALAIDLAPIRFNAVSPGLIDTPRFSKLTEAERNAIFDRLIKNQLIKRVGKPEEVAQAILYLTSNAFVTGTTLFVDGGYTLR